MDTRGGLGQGLAAYGIWGLFPLYWPLLEPDDPYQILAHRIVWAGLVALIVVALRKGSLRAVDRAARIRLVVAGCLIAVNWGTYIWAVNNEHVVETSLGYFITPLLSVGFGVLLLRERLRTVQWAAIALGIVAVGVLTWDYGRPPWIAIALALSFGVYGLVKKRLPQVPADVGLAWETSGLIIPAAVVAIAYGVPHHAALLVGTGPLTVVPLLLFAGAARRLPLSTVGLLQYVAPVAQLAIGVGIRHEPLTGWRLVGFALVWVALVVLAVDGLRHRTRTSLVDEVLEPV